MTNMKTSRSRVERPSDVSNEELKRLEKILTSDVRPSLVSSDGDVIELHRELNELLLHVVRAMERNQVVSLVPENESFTTQAAANFLGVSRQYLVTLLKDNRIPFHYAGTHRRIELPDLLRFAHERNMKRVEMLESLSKEVVDHDLDSDFIDLSRDDSE